MECIETGTDRIEPCELPTDELLEILNRNYAEGNIQYCDQIMMNAARRGEYFRVHFDPSTMDKPKIFRD